MPEAENDDQKTRNLHICSRAGDRRDRSAGNRLSAGASSP